MTAEVRWISAREIDCLNIGMAAVMDAVETGFTTLGRGQGELPAKLGVHPRENCFIHAMPCYLGGDVDRVGMKSVSAYPTNPVKGLPGITGIMLLSDADTGMPLAVMDAARLTALRTGAASGVYARHFGDLATRSVAIIGTGVQGRTNLLAMKEVFPKLRTIHCYGPREASVRKFIEDMASALPKADFIHARSLEEAVADADVVISCAPIMEHPERPLRRTMLKTDCLAIAVDYDASFHADVFSDANFTCDNFNQYVRTREQGMYFQNDYPGPDDINADMGEICAHMKEGVRKGRRGAVLMGVASHDIMTADLIFNRAEAADIGTRVEL